MDQTLFHIISDNSQIILNEIFQNMYIYTRKQQQNSVHAQSVFKKVDTTLLEKKKNLKFKDFMVVRCVTKNWFFTLEYWLLVNFFKYQEGSFYSYFARLLYFKLSITLSHNRAFQHLSIHLFSKSPFCFNSLFLANASLQLLIIKVTAGLQWSSPCKKKNYLYFFSCSSGH